MKARTGGKRRKSAANGKAKATAATKQDQGEVLGAQWVLRLYVAGQTPKSLTAFANLKRLCEEHLTDRYAIEVVDLSKQPELAQHDQIVALPTLVRKLPKPIKRVIGDLSNVERVTAGMDLKPFRVS